MRPIELTIQGLHSFREKQVVDFTALCEGGVFGIFGPTGSGKSSILDAMTLSLYGKVERAPSNTQGILNHAEDQLAVSFTFSLGKGTRENVYKVERSFKRVKDGGLRQATARFIHVTEDSAVVADKAGDVTREVESLLGLSIDDFTRAVVLPQGKFSEFLSLKGTERRQMLQRLFHLEKYGDELNHKLRQRLMATKHEKELIEKEQVGLGEASQEALAKAKEQLKALEKDISKQHQLLEKSQADYDKAKQLREWSVKLQAVKEEILELDQQKKEMTSKKEDIQLAKEANILFPYVKEVLESKEQIERWHEKEKEANHLVNELKQDVESTKKIYEKAYDYQQNHELPLKMELENLRQIKKKTEDMNKRQSDADQLNKKIASLKQHVDKLKKDQEETKKNRSKYEEGQRKLKDQLTTIQPGTDEKRTVKQANEQKFTLRHLEDQLRENDRQKTEISKEKQTTEKDQEQVRQKYEKNQAQLNDRFKQVNHWYNAIMHKKKLIAKINHEVSQHKVSLEDHRLDMAAVQLRHTLKDGSPCPVCGSKEHHLDQNEVASTVDEGHGSLSRDQIEELEQNAQHLERSMDEMIWKLNQTAEQSPVSPDLNENSEPVSEQLDFPSIDDERFLSQLEQSTNQWEKEQEAISSLLRSWDQERQQLATSSEDLSKINLVLTQVSTRYDEIDQERKKKQQTYDELLVEWQEKFSTIKYSEIDDVAKDLQKREEDADALRIRIEKSVPIIEEIHQSLESLSEQIQQGLVDISKYESEYYERLKTIEEMTRDIQEVAKGQNVDEQLHLKQLELEKMIAETSTSKTKLQVVEDKMTKAENTLMQTSHSLKEAKTRHERSLTRWNEQRKDSSYSEMADVEKWTKPPATIKEWEEKVTAYDNQCRDASLKQRQLQEQLQSKEMTEESFKNIETVYNETKVKLEHLQSAIGAAKHYYEELTKKADRYEQLEKQRNEYEELHGKLAKLDKVFRGKEFVEFIAEEQLVQVSQLASDRLSVLTRGRYAIEVDSSGGFIMRDDANGGVKRPVTTLSGGETFLTSLALALSLSASIQLKGDHALEFFFLDEGFGTLDPELLETVVTALEQLHTDQLSVGVISHVPELRERLPRKLIVTSAEPGGKGSRVEIENL